MNPLLAVLAVGLPAASFAAGVAVGRAIERRPKMSPRTDVVASRTRTFYERWAPLLYVLIFVIAAFGVFIGSTSALASGRVVDCLERHADANAERSAKVLEASELLTTRQKRSARALQDALIAAEGTAAQRHLFIKFVGANGRLVAAYRNLEAVREENPAIPDPATFCDL